MTGPRIARAVPNGERGERDRSDESLHALHPEVGDVAPKDKGHELHTKNSPESDAGSYLVAASVVLAVALLAAWRPARQAARVNPMTILRDG